MAPRTRARNMIMQVLCVVHIFQLNVHEEFRALGCRVSQLWMQNAVYRL